MREEELYPAVVNWLKMNGYEAIVTGGERLLSIPVVSYLPGKLYLEPDVVGFKEPADLVAVEVKSDSKAMLEGLGKCLAYSAAADQVYLTLTDDLCGDIRSVRFFECLKIGLLCLSKDYGGLHQELLRQTKAALGKDKST